MSVLKLFQVVKWKSWKGLNKIMVRQKNYKVLSIDGGGIKGLYSAYILKYIEKEFNIKLHDYFDMFSGTSTGGIIALALAYNVPIETIIEFYLKKGPNIFPYKNTLTRIWGGVKQILLFGKYSNNVLHSALKEVFGEAKVKDLEKDICIPALRLSNQQLTVFKKDHSPNLNMHNEIPLYKIALATSAAPTYFPIVQVDELANGYYIDGGLGANDPAVIGAIEASKYFLNKEVGDKFDILSISSVDDSCGYSSIRQKRRASILWLLNLIELIMNVQSKTTFFNMQFLKDILPCNKYIKIPSPTLSNKQRSCIKMDLASKKALITLENLAHDVWIKQKNDIDLIEFFKS